MGKKGKPGQIKKRDLEKIIEISIKLSSTYNFNELLENIIEEARKITNCDAGSIYLKNNNKLKFFITQSETLIKRYGEKDFKRLFKPFEIPINEKSVAGYCALTKTILNIPDVHKLDKKYPFKYNDYWDKKNNYNTVSILTIPLITNENELIGVLQLINAKDEKGNIIPFSNKYEKVIEALSSHAAIAIYNRTLNKELHDAYIDTIMKLGKLSEYRDRETFNHLNRMSNYSFLIALKYGFDHEEALNIKYASLMHDVGKIGIPDSILQKPAKLTPEEKEIMKTHTIIGANILKSESSYLLNIAAKIALTHHEKWDGTGYPIGLKGVDIPIEGRIVALADVFDALSSKRVYKEAFPIEKVINIIKCEKGKHFDPFLVDLFLDLVDKFVEIKERFSDEGEEIIDITKNYKELKPDITILYYTR